MVPFIYVVGTKPQRKALDAITGFNQVLLCTLSPKECRSIPKKAECQDTPNLPANTGRKKRSCERTLALTPVNAEGLCTRLR